MLDNLNLSSFVKMFIVLHKQHSTNRTNVRCLWQAFCVDSRVFVWLHNVCQGCRKMSGLGEVTSRPGWIWGRGCDNLWWHFLAFIATSKRLRQCLILLEHPFAKSLTMLLIYDRYNRLWRCFITRRQWSPFHFIKILTIESNYK